MIDITTFGSGSSGNGYALDDGINQILLEAGISYKNAAPKMNFDFRRVVGMFITHEHGDHVKYLSQYLEKTSFPVFMSHGTAKALHLEPSYRIHLLKSFQTVKVGSWKVTPFSVEHDAAEPFGYVAANEVGNRLLYVTDSYFVPWKFKHISHMLVEMNYAEDIAADNDHQQILNHQLHDRILTSHFEMQNALKFIMENKSPDLQQIVLIHVSETNGDPARFKTVTEQLTGVPVDVAGR